MASESDPVLDALNEEMRSLQETLEELIESNKELEGSKGTKGLLSMGFTPLTKGLGFLGTTLKTLTGVFSSSLLKHGKGVTELIKNNSSLANTLEKSIESNEELEGPKGIKGLLSRGFTPLTKGFDILVTALKAATGVFSSSRGKHDKVETELRKNNSSLSENLGKSIKGSLSMGVKSLTIGLNILGTVLGTVIGVFKSSLVMYDKVETELRRNSFNLSENLATAESMSIVMGEMVNSLDAAQFMMVSQRTGLDQNSKELQGLFKTVQDLGGDFGMFTAQLRQNTIGTENSSDALIKTMEGTTKSTNISRDNLIKALDSVSTEMVNMMSAVSQGGAEGVQRSSLILRGVLKDPTLFRGAMASITQLVQAGGFQTAALAGVTDLRKQMFQDTGPGAAIQATIRMGQAAQRIADQVKGSELAPEILEGFQNIPGMMNIGAQVRVLEQMRDFARDELGLSEEAIMDSKRLAEAITQDVQAKEQADKTIVRSLESLKREILAPFVNAMAGFGKEIKGWIDLNSKTISDMMPVVANVFKKVGMAILDGVISLLNWLGSFDIANSLQSAAASLKSLEIETAKENLAKQTERNKEEQEKRLEKARENMLKAQDLSLKLQIRQTYRVIDLLEKGNSHSEEIRNLTMDQKQVIAPNASTPGVGVSTLRPVGKGK